MCNGFDSFRLARTIVCPICRIEFIDIEASRKYHGSGECAKRLKNKHCNGW